MKEIYPILGIIAVVVIFKSFKYLTRAARRLIFRLRYNMKTTHNNRIQHIEINKELLEKIVEKNYLQ